MTNTKTTKRALLSSVLALFLCFAMLLGTTFAWFTDSVSSKGNIIQTGELKVGFQWADGKEDPATATWTDVEGTLFGYDNWEPGYAVAKHFKVSNEGTLALNYQMRIVAEGVVSKLADVIDVYFVRNANAAIARTDLKTAVDAANATDADNLIKIGTFKDILGTDLNLAKYAKGSIKADAEANVHTLVFKMQETANDDYQAMDLGCTFTVELLATQMADENDSFDNKYDDETKVPSNAIPAARITTIDELNISATIGIGGNVEAFELDAGFQFEPTISAEDVMMSEYKHWHPDFYVYADRDVPAGSIALAGYYNEWCQYNNNNWVALTNDGMPVESGKENGVRLVNSLACVTYKDICQYGNDGIGFRCGVASLNDAALAGTTITVEFRLYETENEWSDPSHNCQEVGSENYIVLGKINYTFSYPATETVTVTNDTELAEAIANGKTNISLANGTYHMPSAAKGKVFTVSGASGNAEDVIIEVVPGGQGEANGQLDYNLDGSNVCFNNVTVKTNNQLYAGFARLEATYNNCIIQNTFNLATGKAVFNTCVFNITSEYVRVGGASKAEFNGCTFNTDGRAILVFQDGTSVAQEVIVKDCTFNATAAAQTWNGIHVAAVSYDGSQGGTYTVTFEGNNVVDSDFNGLWQIKAGEANVTVNGLN